MGIAAAPDERRGSFCTATGHPSDRLFRFGSGERSQFRCTRHALTYRPLVRTAALTALVVGTLLTTINQGNLIAAGTFPAELTWKVPLTYSVPYMVATWSALRMAYVRSDS